MAELPTMPVRTDALLGDTADMTPTEFGAYVRILIAMWRNGGWLPNDERRLSRCGTLTAGQWARSRARIMECLVAMGDGRVTQGKLHEEYQRARDVSDQASANAASGWKKRRREVAVEQEGGVAVEPQAGSIENSAQPKSRKYNVSHDAGASPAQCYPDPVSKETLGGGDSRADEDRQHDEIIEAVGVDPAKDMRLRFIGPQGRATVDRWRDLGLSQAEIIEIIRGVMGGKRDGPPSSFAYFDRPMRLAAGQKQAPPLSPIQPPALQDGDSHGRQVSSAHASRSDRRLDSFLRGATG